MLSTVSRTLVRKSRCEFPIRSLRWSSSSSSSDESAKQQNSSSKEIGNPITWANPNSGPSQDDRSSNAWRWVYPVGLGMILFASLVSRYRNKKDDTDSSPQDRSARLGSAMQRLDFVTKTPEAQRDISKKYQDDDY